MKEEIKKLVETLQATNNKIRDYMKDEQKLIEELADLNTKMQVIEFAETSKIMGKYVDGKPVFKNQTERDIELHAQLKLNNRYQELYNKRRDTGRQYGNAKIERQYSERHFSILKRVLNLATEVAE